jgi:hypothetical protein
MSGGCEILDAHHVSSPVQWEPECMLAGSNSGNPDVRSHGVTDSTQNIHGVVVVAKTTWELPIFCARVSG